MKRTLIILALLGTALSPATAQSVPAEMEDTGSSATAETLATSDDEANRMTVPVMINGQGPFNFIVDTGSDRSVISKEVAEKLALPEAGRAKLISMSGVDSVKLVTIKSLSVSANRTLRNIRAPALAAKNLGADGILGIDALKGQRVLFDFSAQTMTVEPGNTKAVREEIVPRDVIVVRARSRLGQLVLVDADANGEEVWVVVDTGGQNSIANSAFRRLMVKKSAPAGSFKTIDLLSVVGGRITADYTVVGKMRIGGVQLGNAAVAFVDAHPFKSFGLMRRPAMLLGMEGLRSFRRVSIDFANKEVRFHMPEGVVVGGSM